MEGSPNIRFAPAETHWSRIHRLTRPSSPDPSGRHAWEQAWLYLQDTFRPAMLRTVRRQLARTGGGFVRMEDAEDVVQGFFAACIEHDYLARADERRGRFRAFISVCLQRYVSKYVQYCRRKRRSPALPPVSLDTSLGEVPDAASTKAWNEIFEEEWVRCVLEAALPRVGARSPRNERLLRLLYAEPDLSTKDAAARLDVDASKIPLRLHRARRMLAEEFWEVVKATVSDGRQLEEERARMSTLLTRHLEVRHAPSLFG